MADKTYITINVTLFKLSLYVNISQLKLMLTAETWSMVVKNMFSAQIVHSSISNNK